MTCYTARASEYNTLYTPHTNVKGRCQGSHFPDEALGLGEVKYLAHIRATLEQSWDSNPGVSEPAATFLLSKVWKSDPIMSFVKW